MECQLCHSSFSSRNQLFKHIRDLHDTKSSTIACDICLRGPKEIECVYSDNNVVVLRKPQGVPTLQASSTSRSLYSIYERRFGESQRKCLPCHRLDAATGGLVICSISKESEIFLKKCFRLRLINKKYRAIVIGSIDMDSGVVESSIGGKIAISSYQVVKRTFSRNFGTLTTVDVWPKTGRFHQIRKHMLLLGHPILGDRQYSHASQWPRECNELFLWAIETIFPDPNSSKELDDWMQEKLLIAEARNGACGPGGKGNPIPQFSKDDNNDDEDELMDGFEEENKIPIHSKICISIPEPDYYEQYRMLEAETLS